MTRQRLKIAICPVVTKIQAQKLADADPRFEVSWDPILYAPQRFDGDADGDPAWQRPPALQARYDNMCDSADALFGLPDSRAVNLRRCVEANQRLIWVHTMAAGGGAQIKAAGLAPADLSRLIFTTSAGVHAQTLAEFALYGVLAGAKQLPAMQQQQRDHVWGELTPVRHVRDMTIAVVGMGNIGRLVATRFLALGAQVIGVNRSLRDIPGVEMHTDADLIEVATRSDAVINCLPATVETEKLISSHVLAAAKPGLIIVSLGRGSCIDEDAMIAQLRSGHIAFAALDVVAQEPLPSDSPLWDMPNVLLSPHNMAFDAHLIDDIIDLFISNAKCLLDGRPLQNVVDKHLFY